MRAGIMLDLDGCIFDFRAGFIKRLRERYGIILCEENWKTYYPQDCHPEITGRILINLCFDPETFFLSPALPGAVWFVNRLREMGDIHVVSNRNVPESVSAEMLQSAGISYDALVHTSEKSAYVEAHGLAVAIEDTPDQAYKIAAHCPVALLPYASNTGQSFDTPIYRYSSYFTALDVARWAIHDHREQIKDKQQMYRHLQAGRLGNTSRVFPDLAAVEAAGVNIGIRYNSGTGGRRFDSHVPAHEVRQRLEEWKRDGLDVNAAQFSEMIPDEWIVFTGEAQRNELGLHLKYSFDKIHFRIAMENPRYASMLRAKALMDTYMSPAGREEIERIWERWPDAIVEFTTFDRPVGTLADPTIFWEGRNY